MNRGTSHSLGEIDLSKYSSVTITYGSDASAKLGDVGTFLALTSNSAVENADSSTKTDANILAQATLSNATGAWATANRTVTIDLSEVVYSGEVYLAADMKDGNGLAVAAIVFNP